jgi:hypothetical protein
LELTFEIVEQLLAVNIGRKVHCRDDAIDGVEV